MLANTLIQPTLLFTQISDMWVWTRLVYALCTHFSVFYSSQYKKRPIYWSDTGQDIKLWFDNKQVSPGKPLSLGDSRGTTIQFINRNYSE